MLNRAMPSVETFILCFVTIFFAFSTFTCLPASAQEATNCSALPDAGRLKSIAQNIVHEGASKNGGLGNQEWAAIVNRDGIVCTIVYTGTTRSDQWPGSRVIAASKASTANGLSGHDYALSTANIFGASQPGQSLYSLATSASPNPEAVFGNPATFGTPNDPMIGKAIGGVIVLAADSHSILQMGKLLAALD